MAKNLPPNPSLEHLSNQAKDILKAHKQGDKSVCARLKALHRFSKSTDEEILAADIPLAEAQFVLAMEYGFKTWASMKEAVEHAGLKQPFNTMEDLLILGNRGIQVLMRDLSQLDISIAMLNMPQKVYELFWKNMSRNNRERLKTDWGNRGRNDPAVTACQASILRTANRVAEVEPEILKGGDYPVGEWKTELARELEEKPTNARTAGELAPIFVELSKVARREGLIAMDGFAEKHISDELFRLGLRMTIDGTDVSIVNDILKSRRTTLVQAYERRLDMIIAGIEGIGSGLNPSLMAEKCKAFLQ